MIRKILKSYLNKLTNIELGELRSINILLRQENYKLNLVKGNTALVSKGKEWVNTQKGIIALLERSFDSKITKYAQNRKIEGKIGINLKTGKIIKMDNE
ncbi:MAG TPA: hypothetical protein ENI76_07465 [Ignavibacteria bacterium]|nr:hypothetical protein [Ignavibacteria bacterium]